MHGCRGRMNPFQTLRMCELFGPNGERERNVGICELLLYAVISCHTYDFELRKLLAQALGKPLRRDPEVEAMMSGDKNLADPGVLIHCGIGDAYMMRWPSAVTKPNSRIPHGSSRRGLHIWAPAAFTES